MYVYIYVHIDMYMYTHLCTYIYICIYIYVYKHIHVCTCKFVYVYAYVWILHICIHIHICICMVTHKMCSWGRGCYKSKTIKGWLNRDQEGRIGTPLSLPPSANPSPTILALSRHSCLAVSSSLLLSCLAFLCGGGARRPRHHVPLEIET